MRKIKTGVLITALVLAFATVAFAGNGDKTATPSRAKFIMDGKEVAFDLAYNIENSNYIQLRSVAQALRGTKSQFNVYWDDVLKQAVIETGVPYTGVKPTAAPNPSATPAPAETPKPSYQIGDTVTVGSTEITVTNVFTTSSVNGGSTAIANDGEIFYGITLTVLTPNQPSSGRYWYPNDFVSHILATDGVRYEGRFSDGEDKIYPSKEGSVTVYFRIEQGDTIASIVVSDEQGHNETVSAQ